MIGQSRQFGLMLALLRRYATCSAPVLLEGETGTGKELAAREIHYAGPRRDKPFVPLNCGAIPDSLVESELFGHRRGAFTDAKTAQPGMVDRANGGTLFLDEVDSLSPKAQVTLLRFLQDREYRPVGGGPVRAADVRVIAAANTSLQSLVALGRFRGDLYYRLNPLYVCLPPLREREGDVALLADYFLDVSARRLDVAAKRWSDEARRALVGYAWPGNVRELENVTLRACLGADGDEVGVAELGVAEPAMFAIHPVDPGSPLSAKSPLPFRHPVCDAGGVSHHAASRVPDDANDTLTADRFSVAKACAIESFERDYLMELMRRTAGNVTAAARLSCVERRQLGKLLKKRGIQTKQFRFGE